MPRRGLSSAETVTEVRALDAIFMRTRPGARVKSVNPECGKLKRFLFGHLFALGSHVNELVARRGLGDLSINLVVRDRGEVGRRNGRTRRGTRERWRRSPLLHG